MNQQSYYERVKSSPAIKREGSAWNAHSGDMKELLGLKRTAKLPPEGMPPRLIQGVLVWVAPAALKVVAFRWGKERIVKTSTHRVMAKCPRCGETMSAGRLHQHKCK